MSVLDQLRRPLGSLRISVTDRCNFRCTYCMPADRFPPDYPFLPRSEVLSFEEIRRVAGIFVGAGVRKLRLTGGEPLLRRGVVELVASLKGIPGLKELALTTNGALLGELARPLKAAGLDRLTVSLDSLDPERFAAISDTTVPLARVLEGIEAALAAGFPPPKLNCVLQRGVNEMDILPLAEFGRERGLLVRFIEYMDVGSADGWKLDKVVPSAEVEALLASRWPLARAAVEHPNCVARHLAYADGRGGIGLLLRLRPGPPLRGRPPLHLPLRRHGPRPQGPAARGCRRRGDPGRRGVPVGPPGRPLLGDSHGGHGPPAQGGHAPRGRLKKKFHSPGQAPRLPT